MLNINRTPFCHVIEHGDRFFVYDVGKNGITEVDEVLAAVLPLLGSVEDSQIVDTLGPSYSAADVKRALAEIRSIEKQDGWFQSYRPNIVADRTDGYDWAKYETSLNSLTLALTNQCNLKCQYCQLETGRGAENPSAALIMAQNTALKALHFFAERCTETEEPVISFYGGEPLLCFDVIQAVVHEVGQHPNWPQFCFKIDTNGTWLTDEVIDFVIQHKIHLQISLDGPASTHDHHRRAKNDQPTHAYIVDGIQNILRKAPEAVRRLSYVATMAPPYDILAVADYFASFPPYQQLGIGYRPHVTLNIANLVGSSLDDTARRATELTDLRTNVALARQRYVDQCAGGKRVEMGSALAGFFDQNLIKYYHRPRGSLGETYYPTGACLPGWRRLYVTPDGGFLPCERVGDTLNIGDIERGFDREAIVKLFSTLYAEVHDACRKCWALRLCNICFIDLAEDSELNTNNIATRCATVRRNAEATLRLYLTLLDKGPEAVAFLEHTVRR